MSTDMDAPIYLATIHATGIIPSIVILRIAMDTWSQKRRTVIAEVGADNTRDDDGLDWLRDAQICSDCAEQVKCCVDDHGDYEVEIWGQ